MDTFQPPEQLEGEDLHFDGGFMIWGHDNSFKLVRRNMLPGTRARRGYVHNSATLEGKGTNLIHAEYEFPNSDVIMVTYWTHDGQRIA